MKTRTKYKLFIVAIGIALVLVFALPKTPQPIDENMTAETSAPETTLQQNQNTTSRQAPPNPATPTGQPQPHGSPVAFNVKPTQTEIDKLRNIARSDLATLYTTQTAFYETYRRYTTDFLATGWISWDPRLPYKMGFLEPYRPEETITFSNDLKEDPFRMDTDALIGTNKPNTEIQFSYAPLVEGIRLADYSNLCQKRCAVDAYGYEILMIVPLGYENRVDVWSLNERKELKLVQDGTTTTPKTDP